MKIFRIISRLEVKSHFVIKGPYGGFKKINCPLEIIKNFPDYYVDEIFLRML